MTSQSSAAFQISENLFYLFLFFFFIVDAVSLNSFRRAEFRLTVCVEVSVSDTSHPTSPWYWLWRLMLQTMCEIALPQNTDFLFIYAGKCSFLHTSEGNMTEKSICWIKNRRFFFPPKLNCHQLPRPLPKKHDFYLQLRIQYLKPEYLNPITNRL